MDLSHTKANDPFVLTFLVRSIVCHKLTLSEAPENVNGIMAILPKRYLKLPRVFRREILHPILILTLVKASL